MQTKTSQNLFSATLFFIFALSGFAGLIYELIWTHYLKLFLGHAAYAQTLVLIIFMGGMAIGAWWAAQLTTKIKKLFLAYAFIEVLIGFAALMFDPLFRWLLHYSLDNIIPSIQQIWLISTYKWGLSSLIILPQSILLGMTFPFMSNAIIRKFPKMPGEILAMLYFTNSFGAAIGVLYCGFELIPTLGLPGSLIIASAINCFVAFITWIITRPADQDSQLFTINQATDAAPNKYFFILMISASFITGLASFMYEIGWIRLLTLVLGAASHSFEIMLSSFILGLALGGLWIKKRIDHLQNPVYFLAIVQMIMGLFALLSLFAYSQSFHIMQFFMQALVRNEAGYVTFNWMSYGITMIVMLPTTFCAGMTLPLITRVLLVKGHGESSVGQVYASNTIGAILGVLIAIHIVMPILSLKAVVVIGALFDISLGVILWRQSRHQKSLIVTLFVECCALALLFFGFFFKLDPITMSSGVFRTGRIKTADEVVFIKDGKTATVTVSKISPRPLSNSYQLVIATNGKPDASMGFNASALDEITQILLAALPMSIHPNIKTAAVIGFGSGMTAQTLLHSQTLARVDTIEIEPVMTEGAKQFQPYNSDVFHSPRSHIIFQDAKIFFSNSHQKYDLIVSEPSNPWVSGVASLFTNEFYQQLKKHLAHNGIFCQWLHTYEMNWPLMVSMLKALDENFSHYTLYAINGGDIMILASNDREIPQPSPHIFEIPQMKAMLHNVKIDHMQDFYVRYIVTRTIFHPYLSLIKIPTNSDYYPIVDIYAVKARFLQQNISEFRFLGYLLPFDLLIPSYPVLNAEKITYNAIFTRTALTKQAWQYHELLLNPSSKQEINTQIQWMISMLNPDHPRCITKNNQNAWISSLYPIGLLTSMYLTPQQGNPLWKKIGKQACFETLPKPAKDWLMLFQAINERNIKEMQESSLRLLNETEDTKYIPYLVGVAMIADYAANQTQLAQQLWKKYEVFTLQSLTQNPMLNEQFSLSLAVVKDLVFQNNKI